MTADKSGLLSGIKIAIAILTACMVGGTAIAQSFSRPADLAFNREDLDFVLKQIKISERHAAGTTGNIGYGRWRRWRRRQGKRR